MPDSRWAGGRYVPRCPRETDNGRRDGAVGGPAQVEQATDEPPIPNHPAAWSRRSEGQGTPGGVQSDPLTSSLIDAAALEISTTNAVLLTNNPPRGRGGSSG